MKQVVKGIIAVLIGLLASRGHAEGFRAGAATANITPALGGDIIGGFRPIPSTNIHDQLHVRCLVLDDGDKKLAIVICDLLGIHHGISTSARAQIQERLGIPPEAVLISATHTHSATSALGNRFDLNQSLNDYQKFVASRIADAVQCAHNQLRPAEFAFGTVDIPEHVFNRRWFLRPGTMPPNPFGGIDQVKMNPGAGNANLVEPAGPIDPIVSVLVVREPNQGPLIGLHATYSLHYVGGVASGGDVSADYYGMFSEYVARLLSPEPTDPPFVAMLANGTSGDINNINFRTPRGRQAPYEQMRVVAHDVAEKVAALVASLKFRGDITLDSRYRELEIGYRRPSEAELAWAKETLAKPVDDPKKLDLSVVYAERTLGMAEGPERLPVALQVLRIGDVLIGTMPNEVFCEIGIEFRDRVAPSPAYMISLAHGYLGYLPTPRHHELGGYETWLGTNRLEKTASVKMLDALVEMAKELQTASAAK
ncbi:MAG: neutral/alkaline non-lysosomal ceramidase N-terminal domain-containing protein [Planctomycetaceae bacterium]|nr:neutral/alkaline non-lysosomal ceramidase N-terminal domain-containing protein [Planctomycetaceae bacterium]